MKNYIAVILFGVVFNTGCQPRASNNPRVDNLTRAEELENQARILNNEALCLRVGAGQVAAMAEMKLKQVTCQVQ